MKTYISAMKQIPVAFFALLAFFLLQSAALGSTVDGFVTKINSRTDFLLGQLHVSIGGDAVCYTVKTVLIPPPPRGWVRDPLVTSEVSHRHSRTLRCDTSILSLFTKIKISGEMKGSEALQADKLVIYAIDTKERPLADGVICEETPELSRRRGTAIAKLWLNGYPMEVTRQTFIAVMPPSSALGFKIDLTKPKAYVKGEMPRGSLTRSNQLPKSGDRVIYRATRGPGSPIELVSLKYWPQSANTAEMAYISGFDSIVQNPNYPLKVAGSIRFQGANPISIVPDKFIQEWASSLGDTLVPWRMRKSGINGRQFRFLVVKSFPAMLGNDFVETTGNMPNYQLLKWTASSRTFYRKPNSSEQVHSVVAAPDGTVLIPDTLLPRLKNRSQLASLISVAITSVVQRQTYYVLPESLMPSSWARSSYRYHGDSWSVGSWQTTQALRIGIRQMYLSGYDIREAPFAWAVAQGRPVNNPVIDSKHPDKEIPWYAAYAFNYISQYYKDVDYSKLKRGRTEYQQFLQELYKADPSLKRPEAQQ